LRRKEREKSVEEWIYLKEGRRIPQESSEGALVAGESPLGH
jgi:hypothetical protein